MSSDPYAAALGVDTSSSGAAQQSSSLGPDPYAQALGVSQSAPIVQRQARQPQQPDRFQINDPVEMRKQIVASGDPALLAVFDRNFPNLAQTQQMQQAPAQSANDPNVNQIPSGVNPDGSMKYPSAQAPQPSPGWQQQVVGGAEALRSVLQAPIGMVTGAASFANNIAGGAAQALFGDPNQLANRETPEEAFNRGFQMGGYSPKTAVGQQDAEKISDAINDSGAAALGPMGAETAALASQVGRAIKVGSQAGKNVLEIAFEDRKAAGIPAVKIDPTLGKPVYRQVNGQWQPTGDVHDQPLTPAAAQSVDAQPSTQAPPAASQVYKPTLADATPELQQGMAAQQAKGPLNPDVVARHVEADTLPVPIKLTEGQATLDNDLISAEMNGRGKGAEAPVPSEFYKQQGIAVGQNMDAIRAAAAPDVPQTASIIDHGQSLLDSYKNMDAPIKADITAKYKALSDANGGSLPVNGQDFVASADAALAQQMKGRYVPPAVAGDLDDFRAGGPMTFEQFENLRTNLAAEARKADRNGDGNAAGAVNIVRNSLEQLPMTGETAAIKPLADAARQAAKARFDAIKADPAYKAAVNDPIPAGNPSPVADKFFNSYVTNGKRSNINLMQQHLADDPIAKQTIAAGVLDNLKGALKADPQLGTFTQSGYNNALKNTFAPKINALLDPKTTQQVMALGNTAKLAQAQPRGSYVNNSNTMTALVAERTKDLATHGTNMLFHGVPVGSVVRGVGGKVIDTVRSRNATKKALEPAAGSTRLSEVGK